MLCGDVLDDGDGDLCRPGENLLVDTAGNFDACNDCVLLRDVNPDLSVRAFAFGFWGHCSQKRGRGEGGGDTG